MKRAFACAAALIPSLATASPVETFGLLPTDLARAGAGVAAGDVAASAALNPAATALGTRPELALAYGWQHLGLTTRAESAGLSDVHGTTGALGIPFRWGPLALGASAALHIPDADLLRIGLDPPSRARWVMFDNRVHRFVIDAAVSIALGSRVSLGVGASVLVDASGHGIGFRVGAAPSRTVAEGALDVSLPFRAAPTVGVLVRASDRLTFGLRASGALSFAVALDVNATASVPGSGLEGDGVISVRGVDHYTPAELCAGARVAITHHLRADAEITWRRWSDAPSPSSDVGLAIQIGVSPPTLAAHVSAPGYRDIVVPRVAVELDATRAVTLRAGYAFTPTPVPSQTGFTSYADGDRHALAAGASVRLGALLGADFTLDAALSWQHVVPFTAIKRSPLSPGGDLTGDGEILGGSASVRVGW